MDSKDLFALALGLTKPWYVARNELDTANRQLEIGIDFERGGTFPCPECGQAGCKAYDTEERRWRHLNFFQFETVLSARVPRIDCGSCGKRPVQVPWARSGSGFTLLFEALLLTMVPHMPVAAAARLVGEHDTRLWRVIHHYVDQAVATRDDSVRDRREGRFDGGAVRRRPLGPRWRTSLDQRSLHGHVTGVHQGGP